MKRLLALLLILLAASTASAQVVLDTSGAAPGRYYYQIDVAAGGAVSVTPITHVIKLGTDPTPPPVPPPSPNLTERAKAFRSAALAVTGDPNRNQTAAELAVLYREIGRKVSAGEIKGTNTIAAVTKGAADMLLAERKAEAAWKPVRELLTAEWTKVAQEGGNEAAYAKLLADVADGLEASVSPQNVEAIDIEMIMKIIQIILELLKLFPQR